MILSNYEFATAALAYGFWKMIVERQRFRGEGGRGEREGKRGGREGGREGEREIERGERERERDCFFR
jgi:hypothetical protein